MENKEKEGFSEDEFAQLLLVFNKVWNSITTKYFSINFNYIFNALASFL